jgi:hypothetical protein
MYMATSWSRRSILGPRATRVLSKASPSIRPPSTPTLPPVRLPAAADAWSAVAATGTVL